MVTVLLPSVKVDSKGNIYGAGIFYDSDIGTNSYTPITCKVNSDLNVEWIRKLDAGNINTELNYGIEISPNEKTYFHYGFTRIILEDSMSIHMLSY